MISFPKCATHPTDIADVLCLTCKIPICSKCQIETHYEHSLKCVVKEGKKFKIFAAKMQNVIKNIQYGKEILCSQYHQKKKAVEYIDHTINDSTRMCSRYDMSKESDEKLQKIQLQIEESLKAIDKGDYVTFSNTVLKREFNKQIEESLEKMNKFQDCIEDDKKRVKILKYFSESVNMLYQTDMFCNYCTNPICTSHMILCEKCKSKYCTSACFRGRGKSTFFLCIACKENNNKIGIIQCASCKKKSCFLCTKKCIVCLNDFCFSCTHKCKSCQKDVCQTCCYNCKTEPSESSVHCIFCLNDYRALKCCRNLVVKQNIIVCSEKSFLLQKKTEYSGNKYFHRSAIIKSNIYYLTSQTMNICNVICQKSVSYPNLLPISISDNFLIAVGSKWVYTIGGKASSGSIKTTFKFNTSCHKWFIAPSIAELITDVSYCVMNSHYIFVFRQAIIYKLDVLDEEQDWNKIEVEQISEVPKVVLQYSTHSFLFLSNNKSHNFNIYKKKRSDLFLKTKNSQPYYSYYAICKQKLHYFEYYSYSPDYTYTTAFINQPKDFTWGFSEIGSRK